MVSLMSDARIVFLVWFIAIAVLVAVILIFIEWKLNKTRAEEAAKKKEKTPIDKMRIFLKKDVGLREKLDVIGKTAKDYFKEKYGMSIGLRYSELIEEFKKKGQGFEAKFCEGMFEAYYFDHKLNKRAIDELSAMLVEIYKKGETASLPKTLGHGGIEKLDKFIGDVQDAVTGKVGEYVKTHEEKIERVARIARREEYELLSWVRKAIHGGHDKKNVSELLKRAGHSKKNIKNVLKVYDKETKKIRKEERAHRGEGVAQRIVQKEKERLGAELKK